MTEKQPFYARIVQAQNDLKVPKNQFNKFGNYAYRSAEDIEEAVKPVNQENGLFLHLTDEVVEIGGKNYVKATATLFDIHDEKLNVSVTSFAREAENKKGMDDSQITGTASSYARKYALNGLYLIDDQKDADTNENKQESEKKRKQTVEQEFYNNRDEVTERLRTVAKQTGKGYTELEQYAIKKANEKLGKEFNNINSQNIGQVVGIVKLMEQKIQNKGA